MRDRFLGATITDDLLQRLIPDRSNFDSSFRGALLREPGIHNPGWSTARPVGMDSGLAGKSPRPRMTTSMGRGQCGLV
jgi:hypothetical protein